MPSQLPRLNLLMTPAMREWIESQRQPCESAAHVVRRLIIDAMDVDAKRPRNGYDAAATPSP